MRKLRTEQEIMAGWKADASQPLVSICCITFNHEPYIEDALDGFLIQETDFPFEILIHDDASMDRTADIIREYEAAYPNLIKPIYQTQNQYSNGNKPGLINRKRAKGKYIALCEGDDYWIDPLKMQKQVDYLEANEDYGIVHGDCHFYYHNKDKWKYNANKALSNKNKIYDKKDLFYRLVDGNYKIRTATVLFRKKLLENIPKNDIQFLMGDTPLWLDLSQITKFKYYDGVFAVYRILSESVSRSKNRKKLYRFGLSMVEMRIYYCNKYCYTINDNLKKRYNKALLTYILYDPKYQPLFPLHMPTPYQQQKFKYFQISFLRKLFKIEFHLIRYLNAGINRLKV